MELLAPYSGNTCTLECAPGDTKAAIVRVKAQGYSLSYLTYDHIIQSEEKLISLALQSDPKARDEGTEQINVYTHKHNDGIFIIYKNDSEDKTLEEELGLPQLQNLEIADQEDQTAVNINIGPGE